MRSMFAGICAVALCAMALSRCGDGYDSPMAPTPQPPTGGGNTGTTVAIVGERGAQSFNPNPVTVVQGEMLVFRNNDNQVHRIVFNDNSFDTGNINAGAASTARAVPTNGANYHCTLHPNMIGSISGTAGQPPPPCTGEYC
jgi:plastocyanin